ncbi:hypothetical protein OsccyDRAFT_2663 [Leptolyngbyaceae cyanobacterium JSC-12]|nr:hypothetical protein OsccyDRAFT_2663 [Leptolyngbyaceae cyanobacterium JSC-12]
MMLNPAVAYSLWLSVSTIALTQTAAVAQPSFNQLSTSQDFSPKLNLPTASQQTLFAARPGIPGRRVGAGSRLYDPHPAFSKHLIEA